VCVCVCVTIGDNWRWDLLAARLHAEFEEIELRTDEQRPTVVVKCWWQMSRSSDFAVNPLKNMNIKRPQQRTIMTKYDWLLIGSWWLSARTVTFGTVRTLGPVCTVSTKSPLHYTNCDNPLIKGQRINILPPTVYKCWRRLIQ